MLLVFKIQDPLYTIMSVLGRLGWGSRVEEDFGESKLPKRPVIGHNKFSRAAIFSFGFRISDIRIWISEVKKTIGKKLAVWFH